MFLPTQASMDNASLGDGRTNVRIPYGVNYSGADVVDDRGSIHKHILAQAILSTRFLG